MWLYYIIDKEFFGGKNIYNNNVINKCIDIKKL